MTAIEERVAQVRQRVADAAERAGRPASRIQLVAVSKKKSPDDIREAYAAGCRDFGESYVQELVTKAPALADLPELRWHFIGHLQRNKVRALLDASPALIHGVDSERLLHEIDKRAAGATTVLLQVNVSGEASKGGCTPEDVTSLLAPERDNVRIAGLMTMPPADEDPRPHFRALRDLAKRHDLDELSMGMSHDFEAAIEEGATVVRVGTAIFGPRG